MGTAPEALFCTLSGFKTDGLVEPVPKSIRVLQPDRLRSARWQGAQWR